MPTSLRENSESHLKRRKDLLQKDVQVICLDLIPINKVAFTGEFRKHGGDCSSMIFHWSECVDRID